MAGPDLELHPAGIRPNVATGAGLSAGLGEKAEPTVILPQEKGSMLTGSLKGPGGQIAGASVCVFGKS